MRAFLSSGSSLEYFYIITGVITLFFALLTLKDEKHPQKLGTAIFWAVLGIIFIGGNKIPPLVSGIMVIFIALLAGIGKVGKGNYYSTSGEFQKKRRDELGNRLLFPIFAISGMAIVFALLKLHPLVGFGVGSVVALIMALIYVPRDSVMHIMDAGRETSDRIGWALILPPYLAALGKLFASAGVGDIVATGFTAVFPMDNQLWALVAYALGMAVFTMIMGNAFAAFAVITAGIGVPIVIGMHGADPATIGVLAMTAGYCGTLLTPMAANFNIVPAALLDIRDEYKVIKVQASMALLLWGTHIALMKYMAF
jgi:uncharacterized membrane protein